MLEALGLPVGELDLVVGGPPCQGFSRAGKRNVMDERNSLLWEFARFIVELRPKAMAMENVPGIVDMMTPEGVPVLDKFCRILEDGGFGAYESFLRALGSQAGAVGLLRGRQVQSAPAKTKPRDKGGAAQLELFSEAAA